MTFNDFLREYAFFIALTIFSVIIILLIFFLLLPKLKKEETPAPELDIDKSAFDELLGGSDNIIKISLNGSRLSVELKDQSLAQLDELKKHGVLRVIVMQTKLVLLISNDLKALFNELP